MIEIKGGGDKGKLLRFVTDPFNVKILTASPVFNNFTTLALSSTEVNKHAVTKATD